MSNRQAEIAKALGVIAPFTSDADVDAEIARRIAFIKDTLTASHTKVLVLGISAVSYTHLTLPTNREV